ncbi:CPBP family intramembrane glutamic endopeptidase [Aliiroseovarius marinus]|uniref:CPBP family intramembrane glutamic endopeptidase n=1 Tax=Aliiroseovarius marinus TaxID=2500159 RepID=UPI003D7DE942
MTRPNDFWTPALPRIELWRSLVGLALIHACFFAATFGIILVAGKIMGRHPAVVVDGNTPADAAAFFLTFLGYHAGLWVTLRLLHKRGFRSLFGPARHIGWRHFTNGVAIALGVVVLAMILGQLQELLLPPELPTPSEIDPARDVGTWAMWLLPACVLVFVQIMAEELVFRGYLLQQLRARFRTIWLWAILPSALFGLLHFDPTTYGVNAYYYVLHTTVVGIVLALVTLQTGNIGAAAGLHFGNNISLVLVGNTGSLEGFSLFLVQVDPMSPVMGHSILVQTGLVVIAYLVWRRLTQRKAPIANTAKAD